MDDILEKAFMESDNLEPYTNDYLLLAIPKRLTYLTESLEELKKKYSPRLVPSPS